MLEKADTKKARRGSKTKVRVRVVEEGRTRVRPDTLAATSDGSRFSDRSTSAITGIAPIARHASAVAIQV